MIGNGTKVVIGSSSLYFADKTFDVIRDHYLAGLFGDAAWILWGVIAGIIAAMLGCGYIAAHKCWTWFRNKSQSCDISQRMKGAAQ